MVVIKTLLITVNNLVWQRTWLCHVFDFAIIRLSFFFLVFLVARCHWTQTPKNVCAWIKIRILASLTGTCKNCKMTAYAYKLDWYLWISIFIIFPEYDFCLSLVHQILNFHWIELTFLPMDRVELIIFSGHYLISLICIV